MSIENVVCQQCQNQSLQSTVICCLPVSTNPCQTVIEWDVSGVANINNTPKVIFICSQNHVWSAERPLGL